MRFIALATDYDGTIAHHGDVPAGTWRALERLRESGRKIILVTGRELDDLLRVLERPALFDLIVAENGAVLYHPVTHEVRVLVPPPSPRFVQILRERGVKHLSAGRVIVSTQEPYEHVMLLAIRDLGLELQVIFNKGAVMALPSGVNKASGLHAALAALKLSPHNVVGVGDAENDHAFLDVCECAVAVANALPAIKEKSDIVTAGDHGVGVAELVVDLLATDLAHVLPRLHRHDIPLGCTRRGATFRMPAQDGSVMVSGTSGAGKSTLVSGLIESFLARHYQALIIDPEGDYPEIEDALILGTGDQAPSVEEIMGALEQPGPTVVANLISIPLEQRPAFLQPLLLRLAELRIRKGRPHWIVLEEAHHLFPRDRPEGPVEVPAALESLVFVTVEPDHLPASILERINLLLVVGRAPDATIRQFCDATGHKPPGLGFGTLKQGFALAWRPDGELTIFETQPPRSARRRHVRNYSHGELNEHDSFYFEGPEAKLHLRAQNLQTFVQLAAGVDDDTWTFHLHHGDYSRWIRRVLKDAELADAVGTIENQRNGSAVDSRQAIREAIESRYTASS